MEPDPPPCEPRDLRHYVGRLRIAQQPTAHSRVRGVHRDVQRREAILDDPLHVPRLEVGQGGEVAVAERQPIVVVADVERPPQVRRVAVHEAEVAMIGAAADPGRLERHAHRPPLGAQHVVLDLPPRGRPHVQHEVLVGGEELPVEEVLERSGIHREELGPGSESQRSTEGARRHGLHTDHNGRLRSSRSF